MSHVMFLKIKLKSLAAESKIIRSQELKLSGGSKLRDELANHRRKDVREESRATHIAYGYLRGREYRQLEGPSSSTPPKDNAARMVKKYGGIAALEGFESWISEPKEKCRAVA